ELQDLEPTDPTKLRSWMVSYYPVKSLDGTPSYVGCVVSEVTELKRVEAEVRQAKEFLQNVIDHIPCAVLWKDQQGRTLGGNQQAANDLGFASPAEMIGKDGFDLLSDREQAGKAMASDQAVLETGEPIVNVEETLTRPDG